METVFSRGWQLLRRRAVQFHWSMASLVLASALITSLSRDTSLLLGCSSDRLLDTPWIHRCRNEDSRYQSQSSPAVRTTLKHRRTILIKAEYCNSLMPVFIIATHRPHHSNPASSSASLHLGSRSLLMADYGLYGPIGGSE